MVQLTVGQGSMQLRPADSQSWTSTGSTDAYRARLLLMANWANHVALGVLGRFPVSPELFAQSAAVIAGAGRGWAGFRLLQGRALQSEAGLVLTPAVADCVCWHTGLCPGDGWNLERQRHGSRLVTFHLLGPSIESDNM